MNARQAPDLRPEAPVKGQSLVELAILMPLLLIIFGGMVEVSHLLITQNRLSTAARTSAGYGAANFQPDEWPDTAARMGQVTLNTVTGTLEIYDYLWDVWSLHAVTNESGDGFDTFETLHVYGAHDVIDQVTWESLEESVQDDILRELQSTGMSSSGNIEVVATFAYYQIDSILGLPLWRWLGMKTVKAFTVMRVSELPPNVNCSILPISVHFNQYSIYPSNWEPGLQLNAAKYPSDSVEIFPVGNGPSGFQQPVPAPIYENEATMPAIRTDTFVRNWPGVPLQHAQTGYVFWAREEGPSGSYGWLSWQPPSSAERLRSSLTYPGDYLESYSGSPADMGTTGDPPGADTGDQDGILEVHEWVENSTGNISAAEDVVRGYISSGTPITLIMTDATNGQTGENANFRVAGFIVVRLLGYSFQGSQADRWILFEFVDWGDSCPSTEDR